PPSSPLLPYTTLFRSQRRLGAEHPNRRAVEHGRPPRRIVERSRIIALNRGICRHQADVLDQVAIEAAADLLVEQRVEHCFAFILDRKSTRLNSSHVAI